MKKTFAFFIALGSAFISCKKSTSVDSSPNIIGTWKFISETNIGGYYGNADVLNHRGESYEKIIYDSSGEAYTYMQGQVGGHYQYELNQQNKSILFQFVSTDDAFMTTEPCLSSTGCLRRTYIKELTATSLILENTFYRNIEGTDKSLKITDSFVRQ